MREVAIVMRGVEARQNREHDERAWHAWHVAALPMAKRFPTLKSLQTPKKVTRRRMTPDEMMAVAHRWAVATSRPK